MVKHDVFACFDNYQRVKSYIMCNLHNSSKGCFKLVAMCRRFFLVQKSIIVPEKKNWLSRDMRGDKRHCFNNEASFFALLRPPVLHWITVLPKKVGRYCIVSYNEVIIMSSCTHEAGNGYSFVV